MRSKDCFNKAMLQMVCGLWLLAIAALLFFIEPTDTVSVEVTQYCEMVDLYKQSGGESGWPDYQQTYRSECVKR